MNLGGNLDVNLGGKTHNFVTCVIFILLHYFYRVSEWMIMSMNGLWVKPHVRHEWMYEWLCVLTHVGLKCECLTVWAVKDLSSTLGMNEWVVNESFDCSFKFKPQVVSECFVMC